jgi:hypothetical protein
MSSLLNNASLLLNPAGSIISYQEDKIYSVLPKDGTGDFTFSGGDGGTRVNQDGYIAPTPVNLLSNTNTFSGWNLEGGTIAGGFSDPEGGNTAYKYTSIGGNGLWSSLVAFGVAVGYGSGYPLPGSITFSFWIKSVTGNNMTANIGDGVATSGGTVNITGEWQYITRSIVPNGPWGGFYLNNLSDAANGYYIWHPQINIGSTALPYQPTTDRLNYPRITYQNGRGAILNELQSTNLVTYSQQFNQWGNTNCELTSSITTSPDGTQNADLLKANNTANYHAIYQSVSITAGSTYYWSVFVKPAGGFNGSTNTFFLQTNDGTWKNATFNLDNQTVSGTSLVGSFVEKWPDGWYRVGMAITAANTQTATWYIYPTPSPSAETLGGGYYIWGAQLETGTFTLNRATSYIPTTSATVTRVRDIPLVTGVSSLVGQNSGGTIYVSGTPRGGDHEFIALTPGGYNVTDIVVIYYNNGNLRLHLIGSGTTVIGGNALAIPLGQYFKAAVRYQNGSIAYYVNGQQVVTTSATLTFSNTLNRLDINSSNYYYATPGAQEISTAATYTTGLTNTQLAELTTVRSGSGGTISYYGPYTIHTFTGSGTFTPSFSGQVEVLVVAGGGAGGGGDVGGGGGAGGLLYVSSYGVSQGTGITVTVGAGGAGVQNASLAGGNGSNSVFGGLTAIGGGGGAGWTKGTGNDGGSGGGSTWYGVGGQGIDGQGNDGGTGGVAGPPYPQCGGGGAGEAGFPNQSSTVAGNGGDGLPYSISGFSTYYAGGGGGATEGDISTPGTPGTGGLGGGGNGGSQGASILGTPGVNGLGGGGGGCDPQAGASGGSGIVIVRYLT